MGLHLTSQEILDAVSDVGEVDIAWRKKDGWYIGAWKRHGGLTMLWVSKHKVIARAGIDEQTIDHDVKEIWDTVHPLIDGLEDAGLLAQPWKPEDGENDWRDEGSDPKKKLPAHLAHGDWHAESEHGHKLERATWGPYHLLLLDAGGYRLHVRETKHGPPSYVMRHEGAHYTVESAGGKAAHSPAPSAPELEEFRHWATTVLKVLIG
jgi:hypothetical protein